jgi:aminomethyltransferase
MKTTPLHAVHIDSKAKMAEFAGYDMPIQYPDGVLTEHNWTRENAGIFDVSHMGQVFLEGPGAAALWDRLTPSSISALKDGVAKYTVLTNEDGGMVDDLIITRLSDTKFFAVINAGCKDKDIAWIKQHLPGDVKLSVLDDRALVALQGPKAEKVLREALDINAADLGYMRILEHGPCFVSRLGYTGEDGFEISVPAADVTTLWERLSAHPDVKPVGLAARDSLRLEMGYPLYGHDIDATTSPVEADLTWIMGKGANTSFLGASRVLKEMQTGPARKRVGIKLTGKGIARERAEIISAEGQVIGALTSGGFSPTLNAAIGQGYITQTDLPVGTEILVRVRGRDIEGVIAAMPFVKAKTKLAKKSAA